MSFKVRLHQTWHTEEQRVRLTNELNDRCQKAMELLLEHIVNKLGTTQPTIFSGGRLRGLSPSLPGQWPKIVTEALRKSYQYTKKESKGETRHIVFTTSQIAFFMEFGTRKMKRRKQLGTALQETISDMKNIIERG